MHVLLIEDNPDHAVLITELFSQIVDVDLHHESRFQAGMSLLSKVQFDILLCDLNLPDSPIESTVDALKGLQTETPIVILTALNSYDLANKLLHDGIQDYIPKDELSPTLLHRVCNHAIGRKKHQIALERRNQELQTFCESLTHDFKSPIARIAQVTDVLRSRQEESGDLEDADAQLFESINRSTDVSLELIDGLYNYLSVDYRADDYKVIDTIALFTEMDAQMKQTSDLIYTLSISDSLPALYGNKALLKLLFINLVGNGVKYNRNTPEIEITGVMDENMGRSSIIVKDNGIGIDEKYHSEIFKPFSRLHNNREYAGTGLGLGIVKRIVDCHGGSINVNSNQDAGSMFTVSLPAVA